LNTEPCLSRLPTKRPAASAIHLARAAIQPPHAQVACHHRVERRSRELFRSRVRHSAFRFAYGSNQPIALGRCEHQVQHAVDRWVKNGGFLCPKRAAHVRHVIVGLPSRRDQSRASFRNFRIERLTRWVLDASGHAISGNQTEDSVFETAICQCWDEPGATSSCKRIMELLLGSGSVEPELGVPVAGEGLRQAAGAFGSAHGSLCGQTDAFWSSLALEANASNSHSTREGRWIKRNLTVSIEIPLLRPRGHTR
jgi:hypothetical protein